MHSLKSRLVTFVFVLGFGAVNISVWADEQQAASLPFRGQTLAHWVMQANADQGPESLDETVAALAEAVLSDHPKAKLLAADALAVLGPRAKAALPALLAQFDHEFNWVRVSCQAAVGSMGKDAVPGLIETFENSSGGPRSRAANVLAGIGPDAIGAVPVIERIMQAESPVNQQRLAGVLQQIDPARFSADVSAGIKQGARFDPADAPSTSPLGSDDWPQFHGPGRDAICREEGLLQEWPESGPELLWTIEGLGRGYSSVSIANGAIYTMGDRSAGDGEGQFLIGLDLNSRAELWATRIGPPHADGGPRSTPTVDGDRVYAIGTDGDIVCVDAKSGDVRWQRNFVADFQGQFMSSWKFSESPLVDGDRVICTPGGPEATMVALDKLTGETIWKSAIPDLGTSGADGAGYSSAVVAEIDGVRQYVQMVGRGLVGVDAHTGQFLWGYNRIANDVANITSPAVHGDYVFATSAYNTGSVLLKISREGESFRADEVYFIPYRDFQNHHGGIVLVGDYVYGGHGGNRGEPACIELATGKVVWKERPPARGSAAVLYADGHLIYRYDRGEVVLMEATPEGQQITGRFKAPGDEGPAWAHPVIHQGKLYLRHANVLACYDLRAL
jgi:outer membrane protein assembly factor BamB